ncbi:MAG TPA: anti-sigma factor [Mycobacteriales bacterium]|nr:anti-sigma factor [Mycobacteriales bacterium]
MSGGRHDHERYSELVVGHALDALEPADEQLLAEHLPTCVPCRQLLADMSHVGLALAYGVEDAEPPASLLEGIRAGVAANPRATLVSEELLMPVPSAAPAAVSQLDTERRRRRPWISGRVAVMAAAAASVIALGVVGTFAVQATSGRDAANTALVQERQVLSHLDHAGAYTVTLASGGAATGAAVVDGNDLWLVTHDLARNDTKSSIYVLWAANHAGTMVAVSGFDVTAGNVTVVHAKLPAGIGRPSVFGVTHEMGRTLPDVPGNAVLGVRSSI